MIDEFTKYAAKRYAKEFVDVYTSDDEGRPMEAGQYARNNLPERFLVEGSEEHKYLQEKIGEEFEERGWAVQPVH